MATVNTDEGFERKVESVTEWRSGLAINASIYINTKMFIMYIYIVLKPGKFTISQVKLFKYLK